jgi:hypothetical protein
VINFPRDPKSRVARRVDRGFQRRGGGVVRGLKPFTMREKGMVMWMWYGPSLRGRGMWESMESGLVAMVCFVIWQILDLKAR